MPSITVAEWAEKEKGTLLAHQRHIVAIRLQLYFPSSEYFCILFLFYLGGRKILFRPDFERTSQTSQRGILPSHVLWSVFSKTVRA